MFDPLFLTPFDGELYWYEMGRLKMRTILVKAAPLADPALAGKARVVKEGTRQRYIDEATPVEVAESAYYLRKLSAQELVRVKAEAKPRPKRDTVLVPDVSEAVESIEAVTRSTSVDIDDTAEDTPKVRFERDPLEKRRRKRSDKP